MFARFAGVTFGAGAGLCVAVCRLEEKAQLFQAPEDDNFGSFSLRGKTAIITGGASGIGYGICELFAKQGAHVHVLDLRGAEDAAAKMSSTVQRRIAPSSGSQSSITGHSCDMSDAARVEAVFNDIKASAAADGRRIDILVNNAGIAHVGTVVNTKPSDMDRLYNVNIKGVFNGLQNGVKAMQEDGKGGSIVNLASIASVMGLRDRFAYSMTKGAVQTMTLSVATDFMSSGIRCNSVLPGRVFTPFVQGFLKANYAEGEERDNKFKELSAFQPVGRMATSKEVAGVILYLCSDEAAFVTGASYAIDGGCINCRDAISPQ